MRLSGRRKEAKPLGQSNWKIRLLVIFAFSPLLFIIGISIFYAILCPTTWTEDLPVMNTTYQKLAITEYRYAVNVSYGELLRFLANDTTVMADYEYPNHTCGDFAVQLHDDAEAHGIRSGVVAVALNTTGYADMEDNIPTSTGANNSSERGHAFNVFNTTDRGLIYVDATGITSDEKEQGRQPYYMAVYFEPGKPLGEIWVDQSESTDYEYYLQQEHRLMAFKQNVSEYNRKVRAYNDAIDAFNQTSDAYMNEYLAFDKQYKLFSDELNKSISMNASGSLSPIQLQALRHNLTDKLYTLRNNLADIRKENEMLDAQKDRLNEEKAAIRQSDEADWVLVMPRGIVDQVDVFW
jgi:hypothetical protein